MEDTIKSINLLNFNRSYPCMHWFTLSPHRTSCQVM